MDLFLVRHTSVNVPKGLCYGQLDVLLNESFKYEAQEVAGVLSSFNFIQVYSSPLSRCIRLANFCGYENIIYSPNLLELNFGDWEGKLWDDIQGEEAKAWFTNWVDTKAPNGESFQDLITRVSIFIQSLPQKDGKILIFTHAGVINAFRVLLEYVDKHNVFSETPTYGSITQITYDTPHELELNLYD